MCVKMLLGSIPKGENKKTLKLQVKMILDQGGRSCVEEIISLYPNNRKIAEYGQSTLLTINAVERSSTFKKGKRDRTVSSVMRIASQAIIEVQESDPLYGLRPMLKTGVLARGN